MRCNYKYVLQESFNDCGLASLATCLLNFGRQICLQDLKKQITINEKGLSMYDLISLSKKYKIKSFGVKTTIDQLTNKDFPCIAHTIKDQSFYHYIVIFKKNKKTIEIFDPEIGLKTISYKDFNLLTTNIYLLFNQNEIKKTKNNYKTLFKDILKTYKKETTLIMIFSLIIIIFAILANIIIKNLNSNTFISLFIIYLSKNIINYYKVIITNKFHNKLDQNITTKVTTHIINLPLTSFYQKTTGELAYLYEDIDYLKNMIGEVLFSNFLNIILLIVLIIYFIFFEKDILLFFVIYFLLTIYLYQKYSKKINDYYNKQKKKIIEFKSFLYDYLQGLKTIKNLNLKEKIITKLNNKNKEKIDYKTKLSTTTTTYQTIKNILNDSLYLLFLLIGLLNHKNIVDTLVTASLIPTMTMVIDNICNLMLIKNIEEASFNRINSLLKEKQQINQTSSPNLVLRNVLLSKNKKITNLTINDNTKITGLNKKETTKLITKLKQQNITTLEEINHLFIGTLYDNLLLINEDNKKIMSLSKLILNKNLTTIENQKQLLITENANNLNPALKKDIVFLRALLSNNKYLIVKENDLIDIDNKLQNIINQTNIKIIYISNNHKNDNLFTKIINMKGEINESIN